MNKYETVSKPKNSRVPLPFSTGQAGRRDLHRCLILIALSLALSLVLFSHRMFVAPEFSPGAASSKDIRSDRDFLVVDRLATEQKRAEALRTAEPVFDIDDEIAPSRHAMLLKAFRSAGESLSRTKGNISRDSLVAGYHATLFKKLRSEFESTSGLSLTDGEFDALRRKAFSPDILNAVSRMMDDLYRLNLMSRADFQKAETAKGIILRDIRTHKEEEIKNPYSIVLIENVDFLLKNRAAVVLNQENPETRALAVSLVGKILRPNLIFNRTASETRKQSLLDNLKPAYFVVHKNELILREGERISPVHVDVMEAYYQTHRGSGIQKVSLFLGIFSAVLIFIIVLYCICRNLLKNIEDSNIDLLFLAFVSILQVLLVRAGIFIAESVNQAFPFIAIDACYFAIPFAMGPVLVVVFFNRNVALFFSIFLSFIITFLFDEKIPMFLFSFLGSAVAVYHMMHIHRRTVFYRSGLFAGLVNVLVILCISLLSGGITFPGIFLKLLGGLAGGIFSGVIVAGIIPPLETLFGYTTNIKLLELSNLNQPILQRMIVESPGTYHHSIVVASLVEAAAEAILANSLLAKVSAYYHDIGKLSKPLYFIENQLSWKNKHDKLSPKMSSLVIISHVKDGCDLAKRSKLGRAITDIIRQHHGTSVVSYFYERAQKDKNPSIRSIPESYFRYPGPKPQTKEAGLVLLGDVIEASSRTLNDATPSRIKNLVQSRIKQVFNDGQLDDCELTLRDLDKIAEVFERTLNAIFHHRIDYSDPGAGENNGRRESNGSNDIKPPEKAKGRY